MKHAMLAMFAAVVAVLGAGAASLSHGQPEPAKAGAVFTSVDVYVDSGDTGLAAYQVEFVGEVDGGHVKLVGIEGSGGAAGSVFATPPAYDPAALAGNRVVIADFTTAAEGDLPRGSTRVARLHLMVESPGGAGRPVYRVVLVAAGSAVGAHIKATASVVEGDGR
jgi:hypothetical protein